MNRDTQRAILIQQLAGGTLPDTAAAFLTADLRCTVAAMTAALLAAQTSGHQALHAAVMQLWTAELTAMCLVMVARTQTKGHTNE